jgi:putative addiction module component (TIGR02574 family)
MEVVELKLKIRNYLDNADERILRIFNAIIDSEKSELSENQKEELEKRLKSYLENPEIAMDWEEVKNSW